MKGSNKDKINSLLLFTASVFGGLHLINRFIKRRSLETGLLKDGSGTFYNWKYGNVYYRVSGSGEEPVLLIHALSEISGSFEWDPVVKKLENDFRVYTIDLPGCCRSDKPAMEYTNYLYVTLISDFIRDVIGSPAKIVADNLSCSFALTAGLLQPSQIQKIVLIDPPSPEEMKLVPTRRSVFVRRLMSLPIVGECLYNIITSRSNIEYLLREIIYHNPFKVDRKTMELFHESAHAGNGSGRFLRASIDGRLVNWDVTRAAGHVSQDVCLISSDHRKEAQDILQAYLDLCPKAKAEIIHSSGKLSQYEKPDQFCRVLIGFLQD